MANQEQVGILKQGFWVWNAWRAERPTLKIDLNGADLFGVNLTSYYNSWGFFDANLSDADLHGAILTEGKLNKAVLARANLSDSKLMQARLTRADLHGADLSRAFLNGADLGEANLRGANLGEADLRGVRFDRSILSGAKFGGAKIGLSVFTSIDLSEAIEIDKVSHHSHSSIGLDTFHLSKGRIPEVFLRGCGLSDLQIEMAKLANPSLDPEQVADITHKIRQLYLGEGFQFYSCFISYSGKDEEFAKQLHDDLQNNGVRCWFAPEDMKIGDQIRPTIDRQIRLRDKLLVILSENSVKSEWVGDEVEGALEEEQKDNRLVLFPIRLDEAVMNTREDWAAKIKRRRHIGDFSNWQDNSSYQKAFKRLLRDLKATGSELSAGTISAAEGG